MNILHREKNHENSWLESGHGGLAQASHDHSHHSLEQKSHEHSHEHSQEHSHNSRTSQHHHGTSIGGIFHRKPHDPNHSMEVARSEEPRVSTGSHSSLSQAHGFKSGERLKLVAGVLRPQQQPPHVVQGSAMRASSNECSLHDEFEDSPSVSPRHTTSGVVRHEDTTRSSHGTSFDGSTQESFSSRKSMQPAGHNPLIKSLFTHKKTTTSHLDPNGTTCREASHHGTDEKSMSLELTGSVISGGDSHDGSPKSSLHSHASLGSPVGSPHFETTFQQTAPSKPVFPLTAEELSADKFVKIRFLGRGAIGKVYLVRLKDDLRDKPDLYAVKVLTKEDMLKRNKVARVMTEKEVLTTVNHPCIVTMYASFHTNSKLYLIMEYQAGGELFKLLQQQPHKRLPERIVKIYAANIVMALEYLHFMGYVYRDLKPENVLIRGDGHLTLADFDLSKHGTALAPKLLEKKETLADKFRKITHQDDCKLNRLDFAQQEPQLVGDANSFVGTEEYLAPEVINGQNQTAAVDWWTLGILIYEMLFGTTPFRGKTQEETFSNVLHHNSLRFPADVLIAPETKDLIQRLLHVDPQKRLGHGSGASDIKSHKFFNGINFALLLDSPAPIIPVQPVEKMKFSEYTKTLADMDEASPSDEPAADDLQFKGFDSVCNASVNR